MKMQIFEFRIHSGQQGTLGPWNGPTMMWKIPHRGLFIHNLPELKCSDWVTDAKGVNV